MRRTVVKMRTAWLGWLVAVSSIAVLACGAPRERRQVVHGSYSACTTSGRSDACLRFLDDVVGVRSIRLTARVPSQVTHTCKDASRVTRVRVICPPVVPAGGVVGNHELYGPQIVTKASYSMSINNGQNPGHVHWEVGAIRGPSHALWIFDRGNWDAPLPKRPARVIGKRRYLGHVIVLYRFPDSDGQLEGHDAALAAEDGITYFVSIHGHSHDDGDIAMLLAILARHP